jgi:hypothetical protein
MQCTFPSRFWIFHLVLIVDDLEDRAADLRSELAEDAIGFQGLNHKVFEFVHVFKFGKK